ncbi:rhabdoid tumor region protein 1 [Amazona aestiva]|uniref:Rhabdoid tumor region protein 1 n=1 Tax=Amazona aestiva TaxID=12930 RepID=A0A0Q3X8W6_AMAAE|nr:rhabdoid tumor region protein 1 [Amazona aestiva]
MAHARISASLPPNIDPTKAPIAFGRRALPKLNEELQSPELLTQQRALMALCDLVHDPQNVYEALELGVLDNLKTLLVHQDNTVRQKTTEILHIMTMHNVGRHGLIQNGVISALAELFDDPVDICRKNMHLIFEYMSKLTEGATDGNCHNCKTRMVIIRKCEIILYKEKTSCLLEWKDYPTTAKLKLRASCSSFSPQNLAFEGKGFTTALK